MSVEDKSTTEAAKKKFGRREAARLGFEIAVSIVVPILILSTLSEPAALGPLGALVVAACVPLLFFFYDLLVNRHVSAFGLFGAAMTIIGGGLSLIAANGFFYALREGGTYIGLAVAGIISIFMKRPLFMFFAIYGEAKSAADRKRLWHEWDTREIRAAFNRFTVGWIAVLVGVVAVKVALAMVLLTEPFGTLAFNRQLVTYTFIDLPIQITIFGVAVAVTVWRVRAAQARATRFTSAKF